MIDEDMKKLNEAWDEMNHELRILVWEIERLNRDAIGALERLRRIGKGTHQFNKQLNDDFHA